VLLGQVSVVLCYQAYCLVFYVTRPSVWYFVLPGLVSGILCYQA
jgi:hypothetical protein